MSTALTTAQSLVSDLDTVGQLRLFDFCIPHDTPVRQIVEQFQRTPQLPGVLVGESRGRTRMLSRGRCFELLTRPLIHEQSFHTEINTLLDLLSHNDLVLTHDTTIPDAVRCCLSRPPSEVYEPIVVTVATGKQFLLSVQDLLLAQSELLTEANAAVAMQMDEMQCSHRRLAEETAQRQVAEATLRKTNEQLMQKHRLEAIGELAGGVAHEFNNLLQVIRGYTQFAFDDLPAEDVHRGDLDQVLQATDRAGALTRQLLGFSRRQPMLPSEVDPNQVMRELAALLKPMIGGKIRIEARLSNAVGMLYVDVTMIHQMLLNMCLNARDAMPSGGQLLLRTENVRLTETWCRAYPDTKPGRYVLFMVSDTGIGMTPDVRRRVFEPFFTTKEVGKGTGLGLSMVYGVVQQHQGLVHVDSEPGKGTTFRIYLPAMSSESDDALDDEHDEPKEVPALWSLETVLIADDDRMFRKLANHALLRAGYSTKTAENGREAIDQLMAHGDEITLVLLDIEMPVATGRDVLAWVQLNRPDLRILFMSGYDPESPQAAFIGEAGFRMIEKPFDPEKLRRTVHEVLQEDRPCAHLPATC